MGITSVCLGIGYVLMSKLVPTKEDMLEVRTAASRFSHLTRGRQKMPPDLRQRAREQSKGSQAQNILDAVEQASRSDTPIWFENSQAAKRH